MTIKLFYYIRRFGYNMLLPDSFFRKKYERLKQYEKECDREERNFRLGYYFKPDQPFEIPAQAVAVKDFKRTKGTDYYLDLKDFLHYFTPETRFAYHFGDETHVNPYPTLFKARPIHGPNDNSILFKLNKTRHFRWVNDPYKFSEKKNMLVWRGITHNDMRKRLVKEFLDHPLVDAGQTNKPEEDVPWQKKPLSVQQQLAYKFIISVEGNDVASNLKWVMSSNSLCFMPRPKYETWFMEGLLRPGIHYVEVSRDYSDLEEKIRYYSVHEKEAEQIIENAHRHVERFRDPMMEDLLCLKVLETYARLSGQTHACKFCGTT